MELDYEQDIRIDPEALDVEWLGQADLMRRYTRHAAEMKREVDEAKERLEVGKATIEMDIRANPDKYGLSKVTESAIQSVMVLQDEYRQLMKEYIDAKYEADIAIGAVRAVDQRKSALEELVRLLGSSYFAGPRIPRDLATEWIQERQRKEENAKVKIRKHKKKEE